MKLMDRKVWVVKTSEDGLVGVYTSENKAIRKAKNYFNTAGIKNTKLERFDNGSLYQMIGDDITVSFWQTWLNQY